VSCPLPSPKVCSDFPFPPSSPSQFYLVLDVANLTQQEVSLNYPNDKTILIEPKESCRVPIPVERCPLDQLLSDHQQQQLALSKQSKFNPPR
jgi:trafficking protein particle complex subunit 9